MVAASANYVIVFALLTLWYISFGNSEEVTKNDKEFQSKLISAKQYVSIYLSFTLISLLVIDFRQIIE